MFYQCCLVMITARKRKACRMESRRFDTLARALGATTTRRSGVTALIASLIGTDGGMRRRVQRSVARSAVRPGSVAHAGTSVVPASATLAATPRETCAIVAAAA